MRIRLARYLLRAQVDDDMEFFEMLFHGMEILGVKTAAGMIAALWGTATDRSETRISRSMTEGEFHDGTSVRLYGGDTFPTSPNID